MEPSALKGLASKINILPRLTEEATAEQHEIKEPISLNRGSWWHLRQATSSGGRHLSFQATSAHGEWSLLPESSAVDLNTLLAEWFKLQDVLLQMVITFAYCYNLSNLPFLSMSL